MTAMSPVQAYADVVLAKHYELASVVILFFDYFLTLDLEWENIWKRRNWSFATVLFFINRYFPLISYIVVIVSLQDPSWSRISCGEFIRLPLYMVLISETVIFMIVSLRLYALYLRQWQVPFGLALVYVFQLLAGTLGSRGMTVAPNLPERVGCIAYIEPWAFDFFAFYIGISAIFDCIVFVLTLYETLRFRPKGVKIPIADIFLRDGIMYFAIMFSAKVVNFVVFWSVSRNLLTITWTLNHTVTVVMISRLMLNLREHDTLRRKASGTSATFDSISAFYPSVIGNLGGEINGFDTDAKPSFDSESENAWPVTMRWDEIQGSGKQLPEHRHEELDDDDDDVEWHNVVREQKMNYTGNMV